MYAKLPFLLLLSAGLASVSTAYVPHNLEARRVNIVPRQFGGGGQFGGFGGGQNQNQGAQNQGAQNQGDQNQDDQNQDDQNQDDQNQDDQNNNNDNDNNDNNNGALTLDPALIQEASKNDGNNNNVDGQAASETSDINFFDVCEGQTLTEGRQNKDGSCNPIPMGELPAVNNMISTIITSPQFGEEIQANTAFDVNVVIDNIQAGSFTNPDITYYSAPQRLNDQGLVIGHTHVTIQSLGGDPGDLNPDQPPSAQVFTFFKGINEGPQNGVLTAAVEEGLAAGNYRVCTITSASNHQCVNMPVAQRGGQDDCVRFTVVNGNGGDNNNDNGDNNNNGDDNGGDNNGDNGGDNGGDNNNNNNNNNNGQRRGRRRGGRFGGSFKYRPRRVRA